MSSGYSPNPLVKKLGIKDGMRALLLNVPDEVPEIAHFPGFLNCEFELADGLRDRDYIHWFTASRTDIENGLIKIASRLRPEGMFWLSWPKKVSKVPTDITEDVLRQVILPISLVDVKVCAIDDVWSGLKFMWRKENRGNLI